MADWCDRDRKTKVSDAVLKEVRFCSPDWTLQLLSRDIEVVDHRETPNGIGPRPPVEEVEEVEEVEV